MADSADSSFNDSLSSQRIGFHRPTMQQQQQPRSGYNSSRRRSPAPPQPRSPYQQSQQPQQQRRRLNSANRVRKLSLSRNGKSSAPRSSYPVLSSGNKRLNTSRPYDYNKHSGTCACAPQNRHTNFSNTIFFSIFMSWQKKKKRNVIFFLLS